MRICEKYILLTPQPGVTSQQYMSSVGGQFTTTMAQDITLVYIGYISVEEMDPARMVAISLLSSDREIVTAFVAKEFSMSVRFSDDE